jgi:hypothetical protein
MKKRPAASLDSGARGTIFTLCLYDSVKTNEIKLMIKLFGTRKLFKGGYMYLKHIEWALALVNVTLIRTLRFVCNLRLPN